MTELISLAEIFNQKILRIPDYQRGYAWQDDQLNDYWEDLMNLPENHDHYTGMLSIRRLEHKECSKWDEDDLWMVKNKQFYPYHIVDGQQRITTAIILISSILQYARKHRHTYIGEYKIDDIQKTYLYEDNRSGVLRGYIFGYEKDNPSFEYFKYIINGEQAPQDLEETVYTANLQNAKTFFDIKINELAKKGFKPLEDLYLKVITRFQFNIYIIESDFDVNVAFETMNNRGKKLSNLEILKNRLIYLVTMYDDKTLNEDEKASIRQLINKAWKEIYKQLGRNQADPLNDDDYLKNHWILYFKYSRKRGDDYIQYLLKNHFTVKAILGKQREIYLYDNPEESEHYVVNDVYQDDSILHYNEIKDYANHLSELSRYWFYSFNPDYTNEIHYTETEQKWLERLNRVGMAYFRPLVVASMRNQSVTSEQRIRLFKTIERTIFVWFRMATFNNALYGVDGYNFARELLNNNIIEEVITYYEDKFKLHLQSAMKDFINRVENYYTRDGFFDWYDLRYFLFEYEEHLLEKSKRRERLNAWRPAVKGYYSIEHIYPQTPTVWYWLNQFRDYSEAEKDICIKSLGNMLLLSRDINSTLQNHSYPLKCEPQNNDRVGYKNGSYSEREVSDQYPDWNPKSIYERGLKLARFFNERWGTTFSNDDFEVILGMSFIHKDRQSQEAIFNPNHLMDDMNDFFTKLGYKVNIKSTYIQIMKPNWIFDNNDYTSVHFEFKTTKEKFDQLFGTTSTIEFVFHTEASTPKPIREALKNLRKQIQEKQTLNFKDVENYQSSVETLKSRALSIIQQYQNEIDDIIKGNQ